MYKNVRLNFGTPTQREQMFQPSFDADKEDRS